MNRRELIRAGLAYIGAGRPPGIQKRDAYSVGVVSWSFRHYLKVSPQGWPPPSPIPDAKKFDLVDFPQIMRDRFDFALLDLVSTQFASMEASHLDRVTAAVAKAGSRIWNIKIDLAGANISDPDPQARKDSIKRNQDWLDVASRLGSPCARVHAGYFVRGRGDIRDTIDSYKRLAEYGLPRRIKIIVENDGGVTANPDAMVQIVQSVRENIAIGPDTFNFSEEVLFDGLKKIFPYAFTCDVKVMDIGAEGQHKQYDLYRSIRIALDAGYRGPWMIEFVGRMQDPFEGVSRACDLLSRWLRVGEKQNAKHCVADGSGSAAAGGG